MKVENYTPDTLFTPIGPYSHFSRSNGFIHISGTPGVNPATGQLAGNDAYSQAKQIILNFNIMLQSINLDLSHVTHVHVFLKDVNDFAEVNRAYSEVFKNHLPARTVICVADLPKKDALMTMNAIAAE